MTECLNAAAETKALFVADAYSLFGLTITKPGNLIHRKFKHGRIHAKMTL